VSTLDEASLITTFSSGKGVAQQADGTIVLTSQKVNKMYLLETVYALPNTPISMVSLFQPTFLEQWHHRLAHCSPLTIQDMASKGLVDGLKMSETMVNGKCEDCILGCQTHCPFDGKTEKNLTSSNLLHLISGSHLMFSPLGKKPV
jgi:GAG-pre-integrase domain